MNGNLDPPVARVREYGTPGPWVVVLHGGPGAGSYVEVCDARGGQETWQDMLRLQEAGVYPSRFAAIEAPVLMLHGAADSHPGRLIRATLEPYLPHLEYVEWERCGPYPWLETGVRDEFEVLRQWLAKHSG